MEVGLQALGAQVDWDVRSGDRALTILDSNNGKKLAKKGAKDCPPAAATRAGIASPACSSNMASYSACGARAGAGAPRPALGLYSSQSRSALAAGASGAALISQTDSLPGWLFKSPGPPFITASAAPWHASLL